jgi:hypothetical protein
MIGFGASTYGIRTILKGYDVYQLGWTDFFSWDVENWTFYQLISGNITGLDYDWKDIQLYYLGYVALVETFTLVQFLAMKPRKLAVWWPRTAAAYYNLFGYMFTM